MHIYISFIRDFDDAVSEGKKVFTKVPEMQLCLLKCIPSYHLKANAAGVFNIRKMRPNLCMLSLLPFMFTAVLMGIAHG